MITTRRKDWTRGSGSNASMRCRCPTPSATDPTPSFSKAIRAGFQLPHDDVQAAIGREQLNGCRRFWRAGGTGRGVSHAAGGHSRPARAGRAGMGAEQLAELRVRLPADADQKQ